MRKTVVLKFAEMLHKMYFLIYMMEITLLNCWS